MNDIHTLLTEEISGDTILSSTFEIEDILILIGDISKKMEHYKKLKKYRTQSIDTKLVELSEREAALRQVILNTMTKMNEKSLDFPSIGKVSRRKSKSAIVVEDQDMVIDFLDKKGMKDEVVKILPPTIDKRKLNGVVTDLYKLGETIPGVSKVPGNESVSITFEKPKEQDTSTTTAPVAAEEFNLDELDALTI